MIPPAEYPQLPNYLNVIRTHHAAMVMCLAEIQRLCDEFFALARKEGPPNPERGKRYCEIVSRVRSIAIDLSDSMMIQ